MPNVIFKTTTIAAPAECVFDLLADPWHFNKVNPDLVITSATPSPLGGYDTSWEIKFGAMTLAGQSTVIEFVRPSRLIIDTQGGVPSHWVWSIAPDGEDRVTLNLLLEYTVPTPLAFMGKLLEKQNEKTVEVQVTNLKRLAETP
jgi:uncharacterized protein YndB with AHSA1/START domain